MARKEDNRQTNRRIFPVNEKTPRYVAFFFDGEALYPHLVVP
jgi:hypothetical protein